MEELFVQNRPKIKKELIEIEDNYEILHFDEFPILYIGTNKFGNKILGSHLDEDDDTQQIFTLHTILTNSEYYDFVNGKKSYLNLLKESNSICIVIKSFDFKVKSAFDVNFTDLPQEYLPLENSLCPKTTKDHSLQYSISLKGKLADMNKALATEVSRIQNLFSDFIEDRVRSLKGFNAEPKALLQPYTEGSFRINLELNIQQKGKKTNIFFELARFDKFISDYIRYLGADFYDDKELFLSSDQETNSESFKELEDSLSELYEQAQIKKPTNISNLLKKDIRKSINKFEGITEEVGENFESAEIININPKFDQTLALINRDFSNNFQNAVQEIETSDKILVEDTDYKEYSIYIYHLNTDSRIGNAFIKNVNDEDRMSKPKIKIDGDESLETTKYTESLHYSKWVKVSAKATRIGDAYKYLKIQFEEE